MSAEDITVWRNIAIIPIIFGALSALFIILRRERIKDDLRERLFQPLSVRWAPFGSWWGWYSGPRCTFFKVRYVDLEGFIHQARCATGGSGPGRPGVLWKQDEVIGKDESKSVA